MFFFERSDYLSFRHQRARNGKTIERNLKLMAQHGGHPTNTKSCSLGSDIRHPYDVYLTAVILRDPLASRRDHIAGSGLELLKVACLFEVDH